MEQLSSDTAADVLTIGVFFDGTGLNSLNGNYRSKSQTVGGIPTTNEISNIYRLYSLYVCEKEKSNATVKLYIEGVGTESGSDNRLLTDMAFGIGESGAMAKTQLAIDLIHQSILQHYGLQNLQASSGKVKFDIFGFSRGAASARHLVNQLYAAQNNLPSLFPGVNVKKGEIRFLGLFDTVTAIALPRNGLDPHSKDTGPLKISLPRSLEKKVFQISAQHECRYNFPLNSVTPKFPELQLPGSHSDIGGGYPPEEYEHQFLTRPSYSTVADNIPATATKIYKDTLEEYERLIKDPLWGNLFAKAKISVLTEERPTVEDKRQGMMKQVCSGVWLSRRVKYDWALCVLRVMLAAAEDAGCRFNHHDLEKYHPIPEDLRGPLAKAMAQGSATRMGKSLPPFTIPESEVLESMYIHCSAHWGKAENQLDINNLMNFTQTIKPLKVINFPNRPDHKWLRAQYSDEI